MFERYTEKARRVVFRARYEASFARSGTAQLESPCIETEHLLLGLLIEDKALTKRLFRSRASVESVKMQITEHLVVGERISTNVDLPLTDGAKRVLARAWEEAEKLGHKEIRSEHLLLGLLRDDDCLASRILKENGLELKQIRTELASEPHTSGIRPMIAKILENVGMKSEGV